MRIDLLTIHPDLVQSPLSGSLIGKAREKGLLDIRVVNIRDFVAGRHQQTDDYPYGGGAGLVMKPEPIFAAVEAQGGGRVVLLDPQGEPFTQQKAWELSREPHLVLVCGRYEGFDERVRALCHDEVSIGDYILMGGELPALVVIEAVARLVPGVLHDATSPETESFQQGLLEGPQYTRPSEFRGLTVPEVLLQGDHTAIARWRRKEALRRTYLRRPDLLQAAPLSHDDRLLLEEIWWEEAGRGTGKA